MKLAAITLLATALTAGCVSRAGPYVTEISSDGRGGLNVTRCEVKFNKMFDTVDEGRCMQTTVHVGGGRADDVR